MIKERRNQLGYSAHAVGASIGLSETYMREVEYGKRDAFDPNKPKMRTRIETLAAYLEMDAAPLIEQALVERAKVEVPIRCTHPRHARLATRLAKVLPELGETGLDTLERTVGGLET